MLRRYTWDKVKEVCQPYRRRAPERSELYRVVFHTRKKFEAEWEERYQQTYGVLRDEVLEAFDSYLECGQLAHGAARVYCDKCRYSFLVAFSCKKRGVCPSCGSKRAVKFAEHLYDEVLEDVPHRHVVFSVPKRLRPYFKYDRALGSILFKAAWASIEACAQTAQDQHEGQGKIQDPGIPGAVLTLQTAGDALNFNPHLHGLVADKLFAADVAGKPQVTSLAEIDTEPITQVFAEQVLSEFAARELITDEAMSQILSQEHSGFSVWFGEPFQDADSERFVARYVERGPLALERLSVASTPDGDQVSYATKDGEVHKFDALDFLALLSSHIPKTYESVTRYYGWYSCRARGERSKQRKKQELAEARAISANVLPANTTQPEEPSSPASLSWAACIKRVYEVNPLECPRCKGTMRIVAFVHDPVAIKKIMQANGIPDFTAPPPLRVALKSKPGEVPQAEDAELAFADDIADYDA